MSEQVNHVSTEVAMVSATEWMKQLSKQYGIKGAIEEFDTRCGLMGYFDAGTFGGARIIKFESLFRYVSEGFKKSKRWVEQANNTHGRSEFISIDGRFKAIVYNTYNGSGGWKVATKAIGVKIIDLAAK